MFIILIKYRNTSNANALTTRASALLRY